MLLILSQSIPSKSYASLSFGMLLKYNEKAQVNIIVVV